MKVESAHMPFTESCAIIEVKIEERYLTRSWTQRQLSLLTLPEVLQTQSAPRPALATSG